jgi:hypothetical protein
MVFGATLVSGNISDIDDSIYRYITYREKQYKVNPGCVNN